MIRRVIQIDEEKCTGCGLCADACHEGAIGIIDGKAKLLRDDYCDGLGAGTEHPARRRMSGQPDARDLARERRRCAERTNRRGIAAAQLAGADQARAAQGALL